MIWSLPRRGYGRGKLPFSLLQRRHHDHGPKTTAIHRAFTLCVSHVPYCCTYSHLHLQLAADAGDSRALSLMDTLRCEKLWKNSFTPEASAATRVAYYRIEVQRTSTGQPAHLRCLWVSCSDVLACSLCVLACTCVVVRAVRFLVPVEYNTGRQCCLRVQEPVVARPLTWSFQRGCVLRVCMAAGRSVRAWRWQRPWHYRRLFQPHPQSAAESVRWLVGMPSL